VADLTCRADVGAPPAVWSLVMTTPVPAPAAQRTTLLDWYPRTKLEMDEEGRTTKRGKFGAVKHVYPRETMAELRGWLERELPDARLLYWT
jgi:hypothetical protein